MTGSRMQLRRLLAATAAVVLLLPAMPTPVVIGRSPTPTPPTPAPPTVTASGPNIFQATPNATIYYKPMAGRAPYDPIRTLGTTGPNEYHSPTDAVVVGAYLYVLDTGNGRFLKRRASDLVYVAQSPSLGAHTTFAYSLATDGTYLYVTDAGAGAIVVFRASTMAYVGSYGSTGTGKGHFLSPGGIAASGGRVYVADSGNNRVVQLTTWPMVWLKNYGTSGAGTGQFGAPAGVAVIGAYLYVADRSNNRIVRLTTALTGSGWKVKTTYGSPATGFATPTELASDGTSLYAYDSANYTLVKFTSGLVFVRALTGLSGSKAWNFWMGITATPTALYLTHAGQRPGLSDQVTKDSLATLAVTRVSGSNVPTPNKWMAARAIAVDAVNTYVSDRGRISVCPRTGVACTREIDVTGDGTVTGIASDGTYLYVTDSANNNVRKILIATGVEAALYGSFGTGNDQLENPSGIAWAPVSGGTIFVLDKGNARVVTRLASDLTYLNQGGSAGSGDTQLSQPQAIATDGFFLYIADTGNTRVVKWTFGLAQYLTTTASAGSGNGQFNDPQGIATDGDSVWVSDIENANVQRLSAADFTYESKATAAGGKPFTLDSPNQLATIDGRLLILDRNRSRVYEEWGGGPLKVSASPSDASTPVAYLFSWSGSAPAGWSAPDASDSFVNPGVRYFGWSPTATGGTIDVALSNFGSTSAPTGVSVVPDSAAPVITQAPWPLFASPLGTGTSSFGAYIAFTANDGLSGVGKVELARSLNGGAYTAVWTSLYPAGPSTVNDSWATTIKAGTTYRFRLRVTDEVGNVSAWKYGAVFTAAMVQENGVGVTASSGWTRPAIAGSLGGYVRTASAAGKTLTYTGTMSAFIAYGRLTLGGGSFKVYADGVLKGTSMTNAGGSMNRVMLALPPLATKKVHTIKLVSVGDGPIYIDAFVIVR